MNLQHWRCDAQTIEQFLADQLADADQAAFESHLEGCTTCRERLEIMAADRPWWDEARGYLSSGSWLPVPVEPRPSGDTEDYAPTALAGLRGFLAPTDDPRMLGRLGTYEIAGIVGCGGMGVVLKGFDAALNRCVAIKVLSPTLASSGAARQRFAREAKAAAAVVHDNVMPIHAVAEASGLPYLVMPYVRGPSLEKRLREQGPLPVDEVLRIGRQIAAGLAAAHAQGLVHRDIKPANILLEEGIARVRITDFGLARTVDAASVTHSGVIAGTPMYMSPEQAQGETVDHRSDLFSLGSLLYAICTGRPPFRAETPYGILRRITDAAPRPIREINPAIPEWLATVVSRLHEKTPAERFQTAAEVETLLGQCLAHVQQPALAPLPAGLTAPRRRPQRRMRWLAAALLVVGVGLGGEVTLHWTALGRILGGGAMTEQQTDGTTIIEPQPQDLMEQARRRTATLEAELKPRAVPGYGDPTDTTLEEVRQQIEALHKELSP